MITRATTIRALVFVVLTVVLVIYIGAKFLGLFSFVGPRNFTVHMPLADASGLFERGEVTFRGVKVGDVGPLRLTDDGVVADLVIDGSAPSIPADLNAVVADRSAVGERYVDLRPNGDSAPYLHEGSTIPANRVSTPVPVQDVLGNLDKLTASVPLDDLRTTVRELGTAFNGLGPKLGLLLDSTNSLTTTANQDLPQTLALIHDARTVLQTQNDLADPIKSFSSDLRQVTQQLKDSDPDIRRIVDDGPEAGRELSALIDESGPGLSRTFKEGLTTSRITKEHLWSVRALLQGYPILLSMLPTIVPGDGTAHLGLALNVNDPPPCTKGYEATHKRPGTNIGPQPTNYRAFCREPLYSPTDVRGVKPQYPFMNGKPGSVPDWYRAFYRDGPRAGIDPLPGGHGPGHGGSEGTAGPPAQPALPGLLGAPESTGQFGLTPTVLPTG
ncbi:MAG: MCE family protein [Pseudonocardia sp.]|nr:MCE family protein [Pseudonocardia sp.]